MLVMAGCKPTRALRAGEWIQDPATALVTADHKPAWREVVLTVLSDRAESMMVVFWPDDRPGFDGTMVMPAKDGDEIQVATEEMD